MKLKNYIVAATMLFGFTAMGESPVNSDDIPRGALSGRNIAMWQSHGRYHDADEDRWKWQRCRLFGTVEDLYTRSYVVPLLVPMLENAGAYVMLPRERDSNPVELVIDPDGGYAIDGYSEHSGKQKWHQTKSPGFGLHVEMLTDSINPFRSGSARMVKTVDDPDKVSTAQWQAVVSESASYAVYVSYPAMDKAISDARYTVHTAAGDKHFTVNQRMAPGTWVYLGTFPFSRSKHPETLVSLSNLSEQSGTVGADAVRLGGGIGNVGRGPAGAEQVSGMPRWAEAARYWLQWAGMPDSIYANQEGDYRDDIFCRPQWVNYMRDELGVPIDLAMAFHSDAGTLGGDSIVGTLGIYYTARKRGKFADGRSRRLSEKLCSSIVNQVVGDIRAEYDSTWTMRKMRDAKYIEARVPEVPTMLLELLSHQNLADMRYGLDPQFRFDVSRAVYKGILRYLASQKLARYIVQPLAPRQLALNQTADGHFRLSWAPNPDPLEPTAMPSRYIVEIRRGRDASEPFTRLTELTSTELDVEIPAGELHSFRVIAANDGGVSFPSEVMAAGCVRGSRTTVTVVNGFTRLSAPDWFVADSLAGFGLTDPGVPYGTDLSFTGAQYDFDRTQPWIHDDQPGFGASRADMETRPVYGNSFDNVLTHGIAIMDAGFSFCSSSVMSFALDPVPAGAVDLILGLQRETKTGVGQRPARHRAFPPELQRRLRDLTDEGVPVFVSGAYVASDCRDDESRKFLADVLGVRLRSDRASATGRLFETRSIYYSDFCGATFDFSTELGSQPYAVTSPDAIFPAHGSAATIMRYADNQSPAAVAFNPPSHRSVTVGVPFEAVESAPKRRLLMTQILNFLTK